MAKLDLVESQNKDGVLLGAVSSKPYDHASGQQWSLTKNPADLVDYDYVIYGGSLDEICDVLARRYPAPAGLTRVVVLPHYWSYNNMTTESAICVYARPVFIDRGEGSDYPQALVHLKRDGELPVVCARRGKAATGVEYSTIYPVRENSWGIRISGLGLQRQDGGNPNVPVQAETRYTVFSGGIYYDSALDKYVVDAKRCKRVLSSARGARRRSERTAVVGVRALAHRTNAIRSFVVKEIPELGQYAGIPYFSEQISSNYGGEYVRGALVSWIRCAKKLRIATKLRKDRAYRKWLKAVRPYLVGLHKNCPELAKVLRDEIVLCKLTLPKKEAEEIQKW